MHAALATLRRVCSHGHIQKPTLADHDCLAGFWFGLALGRLILAPLNTCIGEKRALYCYLSIAMALEFVIWFRDDLISNAVVGTSSLCTCGALG